ncbi:Na+/H+ antiporter [Curvibacter sp. HBC61]|uniref:Na+/H+ antiporter n=1 Tax=Curvibacter cyanobacteriorum TaxID=3026422 RepID=A0ABT5MYI8_9BURK|nr:Na+/H+ antiporter [Curvibacter sp. HBC61]MDD0838873.1 Na+/H+ antiporter [Curvibacter sp. HBC61]
MQTVLSLLALLALVACSGVVTRFWPRLPQPLLQLALGALAAWPVSGLRVEIDAATFMLLIPPMLFADGWQMPKREFGANRWPILMLAVGLVLITVLVVGHIIHWILPAMPLSVAFVLAAVLSPTDAVAVSAVSQRHPMPARLQNVLEGESLMNDASALVAVKFAVAATLTQQFSWREAGWDLLWMSGGGVLVGWLFSRAFAWVHDRFLFWREGEAAGPSVLLILLMPFAPYLVAEHLGLSGVLAAVAAGMSASLLDLRSTRFNAFHVQAQGTWEVIRFAFTGLVFVLLGQQVPELLQNLQEPLQDLQAAGARMHPGQALGPLLGSTLVIALSLLAVRFGTLLMGVGLPSLLPRRWRRGGLRPVPLSWVAVASLGGIRGGITLAAVLGLPLWLNSGAPFPARDLLVFQTTAIIVISLLGGSLGLPWLLRRLHAAAGPGRPHLEQRWARKRALRAALLALEQVPEGLVARHLGDEAAAQAALIDKVRLRVRHLYQHRLTEVAGDEAGRAVSQSVLGLEKGLRLHVLQAEREALYALRGRHQINDDTLRLLIREIDMVELALRGVV